MKTSVSFIISIFYIMNIYGSDWVNISSETPAPNNISLISSDLETSVLQFNLEGFYKHEVKTPIGTAYIVRLDDCAPLLIKGAPDLCLSATSIIIPDKGKMEIKVISSDYIDFEDIEIAPSKGSILRSVDPNTVPYIYEKQYEQNMFFPGKLTALREPYILRDHRGQTVMIYPFQYNPVTKTLRVHYNIIAKVTKCEEKGSNQKHRNKPLTTIDIDYKAIYSTHFINYNFYSSKYDPVEEEGNMLVISHGSFIDAMQPFVEWKNQKGIATEMIDIAEIGNDTSYINPYIRDKYYNENLKFVLLVGDYNHITSPIVSQGQVENAGGADNLYGYIEGNDHYSEAIVGRISAESIADVETQVERSIYYEKEITEADTWLNKGLGMGSNDPMINYQGYHDWDHIREVIRADLLDYTYVDMDEFYDGTHGGEDLPGDPSAQMVIDKFAEGIGILVYSGHADQTLLCTSNFNTSHAAQLTNLGMLPHVWVLGCYPGKFNSGYCLAESLARSQHNGEPTGTLTSFMSSTAQMWDPPYLMEEEMVDILTEQKHLKRTAGALAINGCMEMNDYFGQAGWGWFTTDTWVFFGDPSLMVRTDIPVEINISNPVINVGVPYTTIINSINGPVDGAKVCLSQNENYYFGITDEFGSVTIENELLPGIALIVVTAYNAKTIYQDIVVVPVEGPFVVHNAIEINDEAGNGNGLMETSESILATITLENVGVEEAENVSAMITTADEYVEIIDNQEIYGNIAVNATASVTDGFAWDVADNIPDMHIVTFELNVTDGNDIWTTFFSVEGHGPDIEIGNMIIDDSQGNGNGRLDPGENIDIYIETFNNGSYHAFNAIGDLSTTSNYLTLNNSTYNFDFIAPGQMEEAVFNVTAAENAPIGITVNFLYEVVSGGYNMQETFTTTIGFIVEDWETCDLSQYDWTTGGNQSWYVSEQNPYEGTCCAKSGDIGDQQSSWLELEYEAFDDDIISFWYKVSSEANYDCLRFYIDNIEQASWAGEVGWAHAEYPVVAGIHTFKWEYDKDGSVSNGGDCAWIDFIVLPAPPITTAFAGPDGFICSGDDYQCEGIATLYNSIYWSTSGTGTFDDCQQLNALYTPSADDITNGSVTLSLTAYGPYNDVTEEMILTISQAPIAIAGEDDVVCSSPTYELIDASAENYVSVEWTTSGDGTFDDDNIINPVYIPGSNDIATGSITLMFMVYGNEPCGYESDDIILSIGTSPTAFAGDDDWIAYNETYTITDATAEYYESVIWSTSGDGSFDALAAVNPTYTPGTMDIENEEVVLTLTATNTACGDVGDDMTLSISPLGVPKNLAGFDISIFPNPSAGQFTIKFDNNIGLIDITVTNLLGEIIFNRITETPDSKSLDINLSEYPIGIYFVKLRTDNSEHIKKIIIQ